MVTKDYTTTSAYNDASDGGKLGRCVYVAGLARQLLRMGHTIIDIKPNRAEHDKTVFVFESTDKLEDDLTMLVDKIKEKRKNDAGKSEVNERIRETFLDKE